MIEQIKVNAELILTLTSKADWVRRIPDHLPKKTRGGETFIWIDSKGNTLECGRDFSAAEKLESYPVKIYRPVCVDDALTNLNQQPATS
jgi:hypothetical protein